MSSVWWLPWEWHDQPAPIQHRPIRAHELGDRQCQGAHAGVVRTEYLSAFAGASVGLGLRNKKILCEVDLDQVLEDRACQSCARPPSTATSLAVMKLLSDDARKAAAAAISAGSAMRWSGVIAP